MESLTRQEEYFFKTWSHSRVPPPWSNPDNVT